jgi:hypothetical protein
MRRIGGLSFSSVPRPGAAASLRHRPSRPFWRQTLAGLCVRPRRKPRRSRLASQPRGWCVGDQAVAQLLRHRLHVRPAQAQFFPDLPVRQVQTHEVEAQNPQSQRLMVSGQHRARKVVKAPRACLAAIALPMRLGIVAPVPDYRMAVTTRTAHALRPTVLAHECEALGVVDQTREVHYVWCRHDGRLLARVVLPPAPAITPDATKLGYPDPNSPPRIPIRAIIFTHQLVM